MQLVSRLAVVAVAAALTSGACTRTDTPGLRFEIAFPHTVHNAPITGRLFLMISRTNEPEVRLQSDWFNSPQIVAVDVHRLPPGQRAVVDGTMLGYPFRTLRELPRGRYYVQAVLNKYGEYRRADGHIVLAHVNQWEGGALNKNRAPGNLYSTVKSADLDGSRAETVELTLTNVVPPATVPRDTEWVKYVRIQSELLTRFWGQPIYLGAVILLPRRYASEVNMSYPVIYFQPGHFYPYPTTSVAAPFGFTTENSPEGVWARQERESNGLETGSEFYESWRADGFPRMVAVSILHPTPYSDMSGVANSVNNGPYEDAIMTELIPYIEQRFRIIREPYARTLTGTDSGGRDALSLQVRRLEFFGGAWVFGPWAFDFRSYFGLNIYENDNAFEVGSSDIPEWARNPSNWFPVDRQIIQTPDGTSLATIRQLSQHDAVMAGKVGGEFATDDAIHGPLGADGYPKPLWDRRTGLIDREVANHWREHGDLAHYTRKNWATIGRHLVGKLHFYVGDADYFKRHEGVRFFEQFLETTTNPYYGGSFQYGPLKSGDWRPMTNAGLINIMADHIRKHAPRGARMEWDDRRAPNVATADGR